MQITLLPPLLASEGVVPVRGAAQAFTPGRRILATVLATGLEGGTLLSLGGRELPTGSALPYPPGTVLRLEVVAGGAQPLLRLVAVESREDASTGAASPPAPLRAGPPVSGITYGLATAVLAAREGLDVRAAAGAVIRWMPALVASGLLTASQADALLKALAPVPVRAAAPDMAPGTETIAQAIADRVANGGLLLERRLADVIGQRRPDAVSVAGADVRSRLAVVAHLLAHAPPGLEDAATAVTALQDAMLADQARTAAHLARDGVVDVRIPLQIQGEPAEMRLRMQIQRDAEQTGEDATTPWRQVRLDLALEGLGRIQVQLGVLAAQVRAEFFVEHPGTADRIEAGLAALGGALQGAGFAQILSRVVVDPVRVCAPDDLPELPPQHTILDARA